MSSDAYDDLKRFIAAFEKLGPFTMDYLNGLFFEAHQELQQKNTNTQFRRKSFEVILELALKRAKLYIAQQEAEQFDKF